MKHVVVDLEMNRMARIYKAERAIWNMETIEIGAVLLDENYQEIGFFKTLVKPQYNSIIEKYYERLTGITTEQVQNAPVFEDALQMFLSWCRSIKDDLCFYQWSETDLEQFLKEIELKQIKLDDQDKKLLSEWNDFQKEYGRKLGLENSVSLSNAVMYAGLEFEGNAHDALNDARNTGYLLEIVRDPDKCEKSLKYAIELLNPTPVGQTLGDLFDFSGFILAS